LKRNSVQIYAAARIGCKTFSTCQPLLF